MALRIGDKAVLNKDVTWDEGMMAAGTVGHVANLIEARGENYAVFNPEETVEMYFVSVKSLTKSK